AFSDPQWLQVDLGSSQTLCGVQLQWEAAYATAYQVQVSDDATTWTTVYATTTGSGGTQTLNVTGTGRYVRMYGTARATQYGYSLWEFQIHTTGSGSSTSPSPSPSSSGSDAFWGDTSTIPAAQNVVEVKILNRTNGQYPDSQVYWSFNGQTHSIAEQPYLDMPANSAGRMYFYLGSPNSQYFDFIEFTVGANVFNGNTTRVDAFGLPIAMRLHAKDGYDVQVGETQQVFAEDRTQLFQDFVNAVPQEFKVLAQTQAPYRIIAPGSDPSFRTGGANANYFSAYAGSVGVTAATSDIFGCAGALASQPDECAALNRHVATLPQSQWSDPTQYYQAAPANYYAKFWHDRAINGLAYGFPYDDVAGQSSFVSHADPQWLEVAVGW
ncbi:beta-1,3-glucanase family protein, partial [Streptacidiphilus monticola]